MQFNAASQLATIDLDAMAPIVRGHRPPPVSIELETFRIHSNQGPYQELSVQNLMRQPIDLVPSDPGPHSLVNVSPASPLADQHSLFL
ncbi:hypothetical protein FHS85_001468 [Rhodoligotrophos appendicifer]|uniref:hypothetical protein n=1 Tax=Rhodoligotrophos appendicifer TaxID=987056 RepID=UPI001186F47E|nr:hypothetical protein [Rhodoligotrophos appendicifer]